MAHNPCTSDSTMVYSSNHKSPWCLFAKLALEGPVTAVINTMCHDSRFRKEYNCTAFRFEPCTFDRPSCNNDVGESGYGVYRKVGSTQWHRAFMYTYLPKDDIPTEYLQEALKNVSLFPEVMSRGNPTSPREVAEKMIVHALIPVCDAMTSEGYSYAFVCAGTTLVLLRTDPTSPDGVMYYIAEAQLDGPGKNCTPAENLATFCLYAIREASDLARAH